MISSKTAKIINFLPKPLLSKIAKMIVDGYLNKYARIRVINEGKLQEIKGPAIFISNHLSNSDGLILNKVLKEKGIWFVAGVKLSKNALTSIGLGVVNTVPINPSSPDKTAISTIIKMLKSGSSIFIFPEGTRSRSASMIEGKKGILLIHKLSKVPLVPIGITGTEKLFPINDNDMGKEKFHHADVTVTVGDGFYAPTKKEDETKEDYEGRALSFVMKKIAQLLPEEYQGVYRER
ncbi:bifunctional protein Aas [Oxobacter pfennigii]|uniref:Bifunctional protein Aas n=1 Tax=Oxobacter pfennigii TaxID=36849 RepID=A0A0P8W9G6_9CLOT|nr:lysophospholipid acyltransferase family protein [Oxobacter pfennigii]KPU45286.1 bifunctional protein Aas [Oxobacter pfennigii]